MVGLCRITVTPDGISAGSWGALFPPVALQQHRLTAVWQTGCSLRENPPFTVVCSERMWLHQWVKVRQCVLVVGIQPQQTIRLQKC